MRLITTLSLLLFAYATQLQAQATLSMQGTIRNSNGSAVSDGKYSITFKLYTTETGGTPVWTETQDEVNVVGGVYSALLGSTNPLNAAFDVPYYVGVAVDGGSELIPRFRLTSAPYALSLIGQGNTFPSSGTVGVGTASPDPNTQLTVSGGSGDGKLLITAPGDKNAILWMRSGNNLSGIETNTSGNLDIIVPQNVFIKPGGRVHLSNGGTIRANTDEDGFVVNGRLLSTSSIFTQTGNFHSANGQDARIYREGDLHILCRGDGYTEMKKALYLPNFATVSGVSAMNYSGGGPAAVVNQTANFSIVADHVIRAAGFFAVSDKRIKKDLHRSSGESDLATLMQLEVTDYRHVDTIANGTRTSKGFIAQQVGEVFPEAVTTTDGWVPDIYSRAVALQVNGGEATISVADAKGIAKGDRIRIYQPKAEKYEYDVIRAEGSTFTVSGWDPSFTDASQVFVYGREVNDFQQVDYDKIHNLNVSATQELARQVEELRAENAALRRKYDDVLRANEAVNGRLAKLEALLDNSTSKL